MKIEINGEIQNPIKEWVFCGMTESAMCRYEVLEHPEHFTHAVLIRVPYVQAKDGETLELAPKRAEVIEWSEGKGGWTYMIRRAIAQTVAELRTIHVEARAEEKAARTIEREAEAAARALRKADRDAAKASRDADRVSAKAGRKARVKRAV